VRQVSSHRVPLPAQATSDGVRDPKQRPPRWYHRRSGAPAALPCAAWLRPCPRPRPPPSVAAAVTVGAAGASMFKEVLGHFQTTKQHRLRRLEVWLGNACSTPPVASPYAPSWPESVSSTCSNKLACGGPNVTATAASGASVAGSAAAAMLRSARPGARRCSCDATTMAALHLRCMGPRAKPPAAWAELVARAGCSAAATGKGWSVGRTLVRLVERVLTLNGRCKHPRLKAAAHLTTNERAAHGPIECRQHILRLHSTV